jgi:hypothetical protein
VVTKALYNYRILGCAFVRETRVKSPREMRSILAPSIVFAIAVVFYTQLSIFVVPPIGAVPEGRTLIITRLNNVNFIDSADAICERLMGGVSLLCRGAVLARVGSTASIYARLPYSETLYSISTGGREYSGAFSANNTPTEQRPRANEDQQAVPSAPVESKVTSGGALAQLQVKLPTPESGNYSQLCSDKWTKRGVLNQEMFNYCMDQQVDGDRTLAELAAKYSSLPWTQQVIDAAIEKWTKRGMRDESMVAYEVSQQVDAYLDIAYASKHSGFQKDALAQCFAEWRRQAP